MKVSTHSANFEISNTRNGCADQKLFSDNIDMGFETTEEIVAEELEKQRRKLRDMTAILDQQHQMLRLIVQVGFFIFMNITWFLDQHRHFDVTLITLTENGN